MRKIKIIVYISLFIIFISMQIMSSLNRIVIYAKHFSLFLILALFSYDLVTLVTKYLIKEYRLKGVKETIVHLGRVLTFAILILSISQFQYRYIFLQEVPYTMGCKYYDRYNSLIYQSHFAQSCPDLTIIENNEARLVFEVTESNVSRDNNRYYIYNENYIVNPTVKTDRLTSVSIQYGSNNKIDSVSYQLTIKNLFTGEGYDDHIEYYSYHKLIENKYSSSSFEQIVLTAHGFFNPSTNELTHPTFKNTDYEKIRYYTVNNMGSSDRSIYQLTKEETSRNGDTRIENVATIEYHINSDNTLTASIKVHDTLAMIESKLIDIVISEQNISYSVNELYKLGNNEQLNLTYESNEDVKYVMRSNKKIKKENNTFYQLIYNFSFINDIGNQNYLIAKPDKTNKNMNEKSIHKDDMIYLIKKTAYGNRVDYMKRRVLIGGSFSFNGENVSEDYLVSQLNWNSDSYILFDLEYQLNAHDDHIFYSESPFLLTK